MGRPHRILGALLVAAAALAVLTSPARAARVVTTSGQEFTGTLTEETDDKVVIQTMSGSVVIPRSSIAEIDTGRKDTGPKIVPVTIDPLKAQEAFQEARESIAAGKWVRAGSLLEGLLKLDATAFPHENRLTATGALITCYLHLKDAKGAVVNLSRRAHLAAGESDKRRLLAAAEALEEAQAPTVGDTVVNTFEGLMKAAMPWKADQVRDKAVEIAAGATGLDKYEAIQEAIRNATERLKNADLYVPGYAAKHREAVLKALVDNIVGAARRAVDICTEEREDLSRYWKTSAASTKVARLYNERAGRYLRRRAQAEGGVRNLTRLAAEEPIEKMFDGGEVGKLLESLEDLEYHLRKPGMQDRYKIELRRAGGY